MRINWDNRVCKSVHRKCIFEKIKINPVSCYLTLAGAQGADIDLGIKLGVLNSATKIITAEHDKIAYTALEKMLASKLCNYLLETELTKLNILPIIDLAYLDFMGNLTSSIIEWIKKNLVNKINEGGRICINMTSGYRGNQVVPHLLDKYEKENIQLFLDTQRYLLDSVGLPANLVRYIALYKIFFETDLFYSYSYDLIVDHYKETCSPHHMVTFILDNMRLKNNELGESFMAKTSNDLVERFLIMDKTYDTLRGYKASLTKFCNNKEIETGTPAKRFRAAIKAVITRRGGNSECL